MRFYYQVACMRHLEMQEAFVRTTFSGYFPNEEAFYMVEFLERHRGCDLRFFEHNDEMYIAGDASGRSKVQRVGDSGERMVAVPTPTAPNWSSLPPLDGKGEAT